MDRAREEEVDFPSHNWQVLVLWQSSMGKYRFLMADIGDVIPQFYIFGLNR